MKANTLYNKYILIKRANKNIIVNPGAFVLQTSQQHPKSTVLYVPSIANQPINAWICLNLPKLARWGGWWLPWKPALFSSAAPLLRALQICHSTAVPPEASPPSIPAPPNSPWIIPSERAVYGKGDWRPLHKESPLQTGWYPHTYLEGSKSCYCAFTSPALPTRDQVWEERRLEPPFPL